jgi:hypothetical protein
MNSDEHKLAERVIVFSSFCAANAANSNRHSIEKSSE